MIGPWNLYFIQSLVSMVQWVKICALMHTESPWKCAHRLLSKIVTSHAHFIPTKRFIQGISPTSFFFTILTLAGAGNWLLKEAGKPRTDMDAFIESHHYITCHNPSFAVYSLLSGPCCWCAFKKPSSSHYYGQVIDKLPMVEAYTMKINGSLIKCWALVLEGH